MSMTSYRNSEEVWEENKTDVVLQDSAYFFINVSEKGGDTKIQYKRAIYYSRYYTENADPIWETARRGMLFQ